MRTATTKRRRKHSKTLQYDYRHFTRQRVGCFLFGADPDAAAGQPVRNAARQRAAMIGGHGGHVPEILGADRRHVARYNSVNRGTAAA